MFRSFLAGAPGRIRTCDPKLRRLVLYPTELRAPERALSTESVKIGIPIAAVQPYRRREGAKAMDARAGRPLTDGERALARAAFGERLDLDRVRLRRGAGANPAAAVALRVADAQSALVDAVDESFHCISVDGHMSTNDTVIALASGVAAASPVTVLPRRRAGIRLAPTSELSLRATWFDNRVSDPVSNVTIATGATVTQQRQNLGRTRIHGMSPHRVSPSSTRRSRNGKNECFLPLVAWTRSTSTCRT